MRNHIAVTCSAAYQACTGVTSHVAKWLHKGMPHGSRWVNFPVSFHIASFHGWSILFLVVYDNFFLDGWKITIHKQLNGVLIVCLPHRLDDVFKRFTDRELYASADKDNQLNADNATTTVKYLDKPGSINEVVRLALLCSLTADIGVENKLSQSPTKSKNEKISIKDSGILINELEN